MVEFQQNPVYPLFKFDKMKYPCHMTSCSTTTSWSTTTTRRRLHARRWLQNYRRVKKLHIKYYKKKRLVPHGTKKVASNQKKKVSYQNATHDLSHDSTELPLHVPLNIRMSSITRTKRVGFPQMCPTQDENSPKHENTIFLCTSMTRTKTVGFPQMCPSQDENSPKHENTIFCTSTTPGRKRSGSHKCALHRMKTHQSTRITSFLLLPLARWKALITSTRK